MNDDKWTKRTKAGFVSSVWNYLGRAATEAFEAKDEAEFDWYSEGQEAFGCVIRGKPITLTPRKKDLHGKLLRPASDSTEGQEAEYVPLEKRNPHLYDELTDPEYARGYVEGLLDDVDAYAEHTRDLKTQVVAANRGAETNAKVNQLMAADLHKTRTALEELVEAGKTARAACQDNLQRFQYKNEQALLDGYTALDVALAKAAAALSKAKEIGKEEVGS